MKHILYVERKGSDRLRCKEFYVNCSRLKVSVVFVFVPCLKENKHLTIKEFQDLPFLREKV